MDDFEHRTLVSGTASRGVVADRAACALLVRESGDVPADAFARCSERLDALTRARRDARDRGDDGPGLTMGETTITATVQVVFALED